MFLHILNDSCPKRPPGSILAPLCLRVLAADLTNKLTYKQDEPAGKLVVRRIIQEKRTEHTILDHHILSTQSFCHNSNIPLFLILTIQDAKIHCLLRNVTVPTYLPTPLRPQPMRSQLYLSMYFLAPKGALEIQMFVCLSVILSFCPHYAFKRVPKSS